MEKRWIRDIEVNRNFEKVVNHLSFGAKARDFPL